LVTKGTLWGYCFSIFSFDIFTFVLAFSPDENLQFFYEEVGKFVKVSTPHLRLAILMTWAGRILIGTIWVIYRFKYVNKKDHSDEDNQSPNPLPIFFKEAFQMKIHPTRKIYKGKKKLRKEDRGDKLQHE
jgi:hypothetical protein